MSEEAAMGGKDLDISGKLNQGLIELFGIVDGVAKELGLPYIVVGATARDIMMHHAHGLSIQRATKDVDFGICVPDWGTYDALKEELRFGGFRGGEVGHRLWSPSGVPLDVMPFGGVESVEYKIEWPPKGETVMSVLGFGEACGHARAVRIRADPPLEIPVATPVGIVLLKLVAWTDRDSSIRAKDATDLRYLLDSYDRLPGVEDEVYEDHEFMLKHDYYSERAASTLLGVHVRKMATEPTMVYLRARFAAEPGQRAANSGLVDGVPTGDERRNLAVEMCGRDPAEELSLVEPMLASFFAGLFGADGEHETINWKERMK